MRRRLRGERIEFGVEFEVEHQAVPVSRPFLGLETGVSLPVVHRPFGLTGGHVEQMAVFVLLGVVLVDIWENFVSQPSRGNGFDRRGNTHKRQSQ